METLVHALRFAAFAWRATIAMPAALGPRRWETLRQFEAVAVAGLPIALGAGASVGLVVWFQTHRLLAAQGAESALPSFLAAAVVIELGPLLAGVLAAGRTGAGLGAELGVMNLSEEVDALEALGGDPIAGLVAPRAVACALAVPFLTVLVDASALAGAWLAEGAAGSLGSALYWRQSFLFLKLSDVGPATLKTAAFGWLVALVACWTGLNCERSAEAVGRAATRSVVRATLAVFAADVVLTPLIQALVARLGLGAW